MSFRGNARGRGGGGGSFSRGRGGDSFGSRGRGRGNFQSSYGPPSTVLEMGSFVHACEGEMVCESINPKIPHFGAPIFLENKTTIGRVEEVLGPINQVYFTIKPQDGIVATSFKSGDKFYIGSEKLLPLDRFLPKPKPPPGTAKPKRAGGAGRGGPGRGGRGGARGGARGGRGGPAFRGGSGFSRGGAGGRGGGRGGTFAPRGGARGGGFSRGGRGYGRGRG